MVLLLCFGVIPAMQSAMKKISEGKMKCENCEKFVSAKVQDFSEKKFNKVLCFECQQKQNNKPTESNQDKVTTPKTDEKAKVNKDGRGQLLIVRQACIEAVAEVMSMNKELDWKKLANEFEEWIWR